jgi:DNA-directed RNA polymerase subunit RPC12/RpoP
MKRKPKKTITAQELRDWLKYKRVKCDCGHRFTIHNLSNTLIILNTGEIRCHECGY